MRVWRRASPIHQSQGNNDRGAPRMDRQTQAKIPVVYILSNGRSGSTLLDLLLGTHPKVWTLGEAHMLPLDVRIKDSHPCGCGARYPDCRFWHPILSKIPMDVGDYPIQYFREQGGGARSLRWGHLSSVMRGRVQKKWEKAAEEYGKVNARFYRQVWRAAEEHRGSPIAWLVDASKDPYRLSWLRSSGLFHLRVIHLMKDPRAFVYSMVQRILRDNPPSNKSMRQIIRFAGRWVVENSLFSQMCRVGYAEDETYFLRYEELATKPQETLEALCRWLGLEFMNNVEQFRKYTNHAIGGNKMRWESTGIRLDERWRNNLPSRYARVIWTLTWPLARAYGYR